MTTPTTAAGNAERARLITPEDQPVFPCWCYNPNRPPIIAWHHFEEDPDFRESTAKSWAVHGWTHWHPDQPTAPTCTPQAAPIQPESERARFEAWAKKRGYPLARFADDSKDRAGRYEYDYVQYFWECWQAALPPGNAEAVGETVAHELAEAFLRWPLPESVCADGCATKQQQGRIGTHLLNYVEAKQMMTDVVLPRITRKEDKYTRAVRLIMDDNAFTEPAGDTVQVHKIALRRAFVAVIDGLGKDLLGKEFGEGKISAGHLRWMLTECLNRIREMPVDKMGRWVGFVQGVMAANGVLDVDAERDRTRPLFEVAYASIPPAGETKAPQGVPRVGPRPITPEDLLKENDAGYAIGLRHGREERDEIIAELHTKISNLKQAAEFSQEWRDIDGVQPAPETKAPQGLREALEHAVNMLDHVSRHEWGGNFPASLRDVIRECRTALAGKECQCENGIVRALGRDNDELIAECPVCTPPTAQPAPSPAREEGAVDSNEAVSETPMTDELLFHLKQITHDHEKGKTDDIETVRLIKAELSAVRDLEVRRAETERALEGARRVNAQLTQVDFRNADIIDKLQGDKIALEIHNVSLRSQLTTARQQLAEARAEVAKNLTWARDLQALFKAENKHAIELAEAGEKLAADLATLRTLASELAGAMEKILRPPTKGPTIEWYELNIKEAEIAIARFRSSTPAPVTTEDHAELPLTIKKTVDDSTVFEFRSTEVNLVVEDYPDGQVILLASKPGSGRNHIWELGATPAP